MRSNASHTKLSGSQDRAAIVIRAALLVVMSCALSQCSSSGPAEVVVSVKDQKLGCYHEGKLTKEFKISTSKFGIGDKPGSCCTPLGKAEVIAKIGHGLPPGAVLKSRSWNGEVLKPNAPGRDPIVSRILWLRGLEGTNRNAYNRYIYIHGTTEENRLGSPASYGCIRMGARDVVDLFGARIPAGKDRLVFLVELDRVDEPLPVAAEPDRDDAQRDHVEETRHRAGGLDVDAHVGDGFGHERARSLAPLRLACQPRA